MIWAYCLKCGSNCCLHLQADHSTMLAPREVDFLRAIVNPENRTQKDIAHVMGMTLATVKAYIQRIAEKLGWSGGSMRGLALWAVVHHEPLGITLPTKEQFR